MLKWFVGIFFAFSLMLIGLYLKKQHLKNFKIKVRKKEVHSCFSNLYYFADHYESTFYNTIYSFITHNSMKHLF
jgi:hypothetical protein